MTPLANNSPTYSIISSKKNKSTLHLFKEYLVFKLEDDHTPRKIFFSEIDEVIIKKQGWIFGIFFLFSLFFLGGSIYLFILESLSVWTLVTAVLLLLSSIVNYIEGNNNLIQVKKGNLKIGVFRSSKPEEISRAYSLIENTLCEQ